MFISGADQTKAELRIPSIKGAIRFWWRALNWGAFCKPDAEETDALHSLHAEEARLFGASKDKDKGGQGCFLLSVASSKGLQSIQSYENIFSNSVKYLAYGLLGDNQNKPRKAIQEGGNFSVELLFKNKTESNDIQQIKDALIALGLFGGLGSRSRHGLGSIMLEKIMEEDSENVTWLKPETQEEYKKVAGSLLDGRLSAINPAPYTCFDKGARVDLLCSANDSFEAALTAFAKPLLMYRSAGRNMGGVHKVLGMKSEKNFKEDHDWKYKNKGNNQRWAEKSLSNDFHPKRIIFGLPHNYGIGTHLSVKPERRDRRSSPLLLHIHQFSSGEFVCVGIFLPTLFLPEGEKINAGGHCVPCCPEYEVISDFLDGRYQESGEPYFPNKKSIYRGSL